MPTLALDHVNLRVAAELLPSVRHFYIDTVGLSEGARPPFNTVGHWLYAGGHPVVHLSVLRDGEHGVARSGGTLDHIAFACEDIGAMCQRLDSFGIDYTISTVPVLGVRQVFFRDPVGNGVELNFAGADDGPSPRRW